MRRGKYNEVKDAMPFVCCVAYLAFLLYNSKKKQMQNEMKLIRNNLDLQLSQAVREISSLRESQTLTRQYRHDMRHHLQYVSTCIENGEVEQAQAYISGICKEIEAQKVQIYCENEAVNLILSSFAGRARKKEIKAFGAYVRSCSVTAGFSALRKRMASLRSDCHYKRVSIRYIFGTIRAFRPH